MRNLTWASVRECLPSKCASESRLSTVGEPVVTKEFREDLGTKDDEGTYDYAYRYWVYWFDLDGRKYRARVYTDSPEEASVMNLDSGRPTQYRDDLQTIGDYMRREAGIRTISALARVADSSRSSPSSSRSLAGQASSHLRTRGAEKSLRAQRKSLRPGGGGVLDLATLAIQDRQKSLALDP